MKNIRKILAIGMASIMALAIVACQKQEVDFKSYSEELGVQRFLDTDWGMSKEQALTALGLKEDDIEEYYSPAFLNENLRCEEYKVKKKMKVNGLEGQVVLTFVENISSIIPVQNYDLSGREVGLYSVMILFNEDNDQKVYDAFKEELSGNKEKITYDKKIDGYTVSKGKVSEIANSKLKQSIIDLYNQTDRPDIFNAEELPLYTVTAGKSLKYKTEEKGIRQVVDIHGGMVALINNLNK